MEDRYRNSNNQYNQNWDRDRNWRENRNEDRDFSNENYGNVYNRNQYDENFNQDNFRRRENQRSGNRWEDQYRSNQANRNYDSGNNRANDWDSSDNTGRAGMYGSDFGSGSRRDMRGGQNYNNTYGSRDEAWPGASTGSGYNPSSRGNDRRHSNENRYGGDTSNYGNANQGGFDRDWWDKTRDEVSSWFGDDDAERRRRADRVQSGEHRGKGPKGYSRSDERVQEDVCVRLSDDSYLDATDIEVKVENGEVTLSGTVRDREQKRRAEDLVERISGVRDVENRIKVKRDNLDVTGRTW